MIPFLLDTLTFVFIVGGLALFWLNLRGSRFANIRIRLRKHSIAPTSAGSAAVALCEIPDPDTCRAHAKACLERADRATKRTDRETWLRTGIEWIKLSQVKTQRRGVRPALARSSVR